MKKLLHLLLLLASAEAHATTVKETKQAEPISFYTNPAGTVLKAAEIDGTTQNLKVNTITNLTGGAVSFPSGVTGVTATISDFSVSAVTGGGSATLKGGFFRLSDGRELATYTGAGNVIGNYGVDLTVALNTVMTASGTTPAINTTYYLYVDLAGLPTAIATADSTARVLVGVQTTNLNLQALAPSQVNTTRFLPIAFVHTVGTTTTWSTGIFGTLGTKSAGPTAPTSSPTVYTLAKQAIGSVGSVGQISAGHYLTTTEWPFTFADNIAFWNMNSALDLSGATACTGGTAACNLSGSNTNAVGLFGVNDGRAATFNGTSNSLNSSDAFFNPGAGKSFSMGGWIASNSYATGGTTYAIMGQLPGLSDRGFLLWLSLSQVHFAVTGTSNTWDSIIDAATTSAAGFTANSWHHVAGVYNQPSGILKLYVDGKFMGSKTLANLRTITSPNFRVGSDVNGSGDFFGGKMSEMFFLNNVVLSDDDVRKISAYRIDHNTNTSVDRQFWRANWYRADGFASQQLDTGWIVSSDANSTWVDFSPYTSTEQIDLRLQDLGISAISAPIRSYDTGFVSASPTFPANHGLSEAPTVVVVQYERTTGSFENLDSGNFCAVTSTQISCDFSPLTISASNRLRVIASAVPAGVSVAPADTANTGTLTNAAQSIGGQKTFVASNLFLTPTSGAAIVQVNSTATNGQNAETRYFGRNTGGTAQTWGTGMNIGDSTASFQVFDVTANLPRFVLAATNGNASFTSNQNAFAVDVTNSSNIGNGIRMSNTSSNAAVSLLQLISSVGTLFNVFSDGSSTLDSAGASANFTFGNLTAAQYANGTQNLIMGGPGTGDAGFLQLVGGPTTDGNTVGRVQFHNFNSANALKRVASVDVRRSGASNNAASMFFQTADSSAVIQQRASVDHTGYWTFGPSTGGAGGGGTGAQEIARFVGGNGTRIVLGANNSLVSGGSHFNWMVGVQDNVSESLEITPSTAIGGLTFSTPVVTANANGNIALGPATYVAAGTASRVTINGIMVASAPVDEGPSEGLTSVTTGGGGGAVGIVTCTMSLAGSSGACGVHLQITTASQISAGAPNATTFVCDAVMGANGGVNVATQGTCTALAGATGGTAVAAPALSWNGTTASTSRQLQLSLAASSHATIKYTIGRRGSGAAAVTLTFP